MWVEYAKRVLRFLARIGDNLVKNSGPSAKRLGRNFLKAQGYAVKDEDR